MKLFLLVKKGLTNKEIEDVLYEILKEGGQPDHRILSCHTSLLEANSRLYDYNKRIRQVNQFGVLLFKKHEFYEVKEIEFKVLE